MRNALTRTLFFHRHGEIRDRTFENQRYRASGLNLAVAAVILWNTVYLRWEYISFNGDYIWFAEPLRDQFRPLRNLRSPFLDSP